MVSEAQTTQFLVMRVIKKQFLLRQKMIVIPLNISLLYLVLRNRQEFLNKISQHPFIESYFSGSSSVHFHPLFTTYH